MSGCAAQVFLVHVLSRVRELKTVRGFAEALYSSRYALLFPRQGLFVQRSAFRCFKEPGSDAHRRVIDALDKERVGAAADFVAAAVNDPAVSAPVRWLWLGNYVEQIAR